MAVSEINTSRTRKIFFRLALAVIFVLIFAGGYSWWQSRQKGQETLPPVRADARILAEGIVMPVHYAEMVMPVSGTVGQVLVEEGDKVQAGQPLLRLNRRDYTAKVSSARANVSRVAAAVEQARVSLEDAQRDLDRQQNLLASGAVSRQQVDKSQAAADRSRAVLNQMQADLQVQESQVAETEGLLEKTELQAPIDGVVEYVGVKVGEAAAEGKVVVRIADPSAWEVRSDDLTEMNVAKVQEGDVVNLTFDGIPGLEIPGKVKQIRSYGEKKRGDMTYTVTVTPGKWDKRLRWNMTAQMAIVPDDEG